MKNGRNVLCRCGSGMKYKKCCLLKERDTSVSFHQQSPILVNHVNQNHHGKPIVMTTTNEPFMPIRLYYTICHMNTFLKNIRALDCITFAEPHHFYVSYWKEAKNLGLSVKHTDVPKPLYPIIIAHGFIMKEHTLHLNLRSFDRGLKMIEWINQHIKSTDLRLTHIASYNALTYVNESTIHSTMSHDYDEFRSEQTLTILKPEDVRDRLEKATALIHDPTEKMRVTTQLLKHMEEEDFARTEKYPAHYYEDGIESIEFALNLRLLVAIEHWKGNIHCKPIDIIRRGLNKEEALQKLLNHSTP